MHSLIMNDRRSEFKQLAKLEHKKRSGRPIHPAFRTQEHKNEVIEFSTNLLRGEHQKNVCDEVSWVYAPKQHAMDKQGVRNKRVDYAKWCLTREGKQIIRDATFVDHKKVTWFGLNKRHQMQCKRRKDDYMDLDSELYMLHNPYVHVYFAANRHGVAMYRHGELRNKKRGRGKTVENHKVDGREVIKAFEEVIAQFMDDTGSDYIICDGVGVQYCPAVVDYLDSIGVTLHSQTDHPAYPSYSHDFNILDFKCFGDYQQDVAKETQALERSETFDLWHDTREALLWEISYDEWMFNPKPARTAKKCIRDYDLLCREVIRRRGDMKNIKVPPRALRCRSVALRGRRR